MLAKLESLEKRYMELEEQLAAPDAYENQERYRKLAKAHADLREVVTLFRRYRELDRQLAENRELLNDADAHARLVLAVLASPSEVGDDGVDLTCGRTLGCVDHEQQDRKSVV